MLDFVTKHALISDQHATQDRQAEACCYALVKGSGKSVKMATQNSNASLDECFPIHTLIGSLASSNPPHSVHVEWAQIRHALLEKSISGR